MKIIEKWKTDEDQVTVEFELNKNPYTFYPEYMEDYIDIPDYSLASAKSMKNETL